MENSDNDSHSSRSLAPPSNKLYSSSECDSTANSSNPKRKSIISKHMQKIVKDGTTVIVCNYCGKEFAWSKPGCYSTCRRHLKGKHPTEYEASLGAQRYSNSDHPFDYTDQNNIELLAIMVAVDNLPFNFCENVNFINFCRTFNPQACSVSESTIVKALSRIYKKQKKDLVKHFKYFEGKVSICADIWKDYWQAFTYIGLTSHFIDEDWTLQKRVLAFRVFDENHAVHDIFSLIQVILNEYQLQDKVFTIGFDNNSTNSSVVPALANLCKPFSDDRFFHQRCVCYVLNSCVQSGLQSLEVFITSIKDLILILWSDIEQMNAWLNFCKANGRQRMRFSYDFPSRWVTTYRLLCQVDQYKDLLCEFMQCHASDIILHHQQQWIVCSKICKLLKVFNDSVNVLSGIYYPTTNQFLIEGIKIVGALDEFAEDIELFTCVQVMKQKWLNYYENIPTIYLLAVVFDPRYRFEGLLECLEKYYNFSHSRVNVNDLVDEIRSLVNAKIEFGSSSSTNSAYAELESYLTTSFEIADDNDDNISFDILQWWKDHEMQFPVLAVIAKQVLSMPVSSVAVEGDFVSFENRLDERRSCLTPDIIDAQACVADWTMAESREQESQADMNEEPDDD